MNIEYDTEWAARLENKYGISEPMAQSSFDDSPDEEQRALADALAWRGEE